MEVMKNVMPQFFIEPYPDVRRKSPQKPVTSTVKPAINTAPVRILSDPNSRLSSHGCNRKHVHMVSCDPMVELLRTLVYCKYWGKCS